ncbi:hypothetical protein D3C74_378190 [compost metagenome]
MVRVALQESLNLGILVSIDFINQLCNVRFNFAPIVWISIKGMAVALFPGGPLPGSVCNGFGRVGTIWISLHFFRLDILQNMGRYYSLNQGVQEWRVHLLHCELHCLVIDFLNGLYLVE